MEIGDKPFDRVGFLNIWSTKAKKGLMVSWRSGEDCSWVSLHSKRVHVSNARALLFLSQVFQRAWATTVWKSSSSQLMAWCRCTICTSGRWQWTKWSSLFMLPQVSELWKHPRQEALNTLRTQSFFFLLELPLPSIVCQNNCKMCCSSQRLWKPTHLSMLS